MSLALKTIDDSATSVQGDVPCSRCGISIPAATMIKRKVRGSAEDRCRDCVATESGRVAHPSSAGDCYPWHGDVDLDTMQPLKPNGELHMPGNRLCGHADCCNRNHVVSHV